MSNTRTVAAAIGISAAAISAFSFLPILTTAIAAGKVFRSINWAMLFGLSLYFINIGIVWTFIESIGEHSGLGREFIGFALSISVLISLAGAAGASFLGTRYGRTLPIVLSGLGQILAIVFLLGVVKAPEFVVAALLYAGLWSFIVPFQYSAISESDDSGNSIMLAPAWQAFGIALGPALASLTSLEQSFSPALIMAAVAIVLSMLFFSRAGSGRIPDR